MKQKIHWGASGLAVIGDDLCFRGSEDKPVPISETLLTDHVSKKEVQKFAHGNLEIWKSRNGRIFKRIIHNDGRKEWVAFDAIRPPKRKPTVAESAKKGEALFDPTPHKVVG